MGTEKPKTNFEKKNFFAIYFEIAFVLETTKDLKFYFVKLCQVSNRSVEVQIHEVGTEANFS